MYIKINYYYEWKKEQNFLIAIHFLPMTKFKNYQHSLEESI